MNKLNQIFGSDPLIFRQIVVASDTWRSGGLKSTDCLFEVMCYNGVQVIGPYLDQVILGTVVLITAYPMAMGLNKIRFLFPILAAISHRSSASFQLKIWNIYTTSYFLYLNEKWKI